jgi:hypothetical protein
VGWLERWDRRNQERADCLMRHPDADHDPASRPERLSYLPDVLGLPFVIFVVVRGGWRWWRRRREDP